MKHNTHSANQEHGTTPPTPPTPGTGTQLPDKPASEPRKTQIKGANGKQQGSRGGKRPNAGRKLGTKKQPYNILHYLTKKDLIEAVAVVNEKVKEKRDLGAAIYIINQSAGTPINRKENVTPTTGGNKVVIILPQKASEFREQGALMIELPEKSSGESAKMERLLGKVSVEPANASGKGQSTGAKAKRPGKAASSSGESGA